MRRRGCDLRVASGGIEPERGELRGIVGVDDVVRESRVLREAAEQRIQDRRGLPLPGECRVAGRCGRDERERVIDRDLGVGRNVAVDAGQGIRVRLKPARVRRCLVVAVQRADGRQKALLSRRGRAQRERPYGVGGTASQIVPLGPAHERVPPVVQRHPPVCHRARRIGGGHGSERPGSFLPPEGVQQGHRALEPHLCVRAARDGEHDAAERLAVMVVGLLGGEATDRSETQHDESRQPERRCHGHWLPEKVTIKCARKPRARQDYRARTCAASASATPLVHPNPSCVGYSPPPAWRRRSTTSYFSVILPVAR